jgi:hypothetical protein
VILYDDTRLLFNKVVPNLGAKRRRLPEGTLEETAQRMASLQESFKEWSTVHLQIAPPKLAFPSAPINPIGSTASNPPPAPQLTMASFSSKFIRQSEKYECTVCDKRFHSPSYLRGHMYLLHRSEKCKFFSTNLVSCGSLLLLTMPTLAFVCEVEGCDRRYAFMFALRRHERVVHRNQTETP